MWYLVRGDNDSNQYLLTSTLKIRIPTLSKLLGDNGLGHHPLLLLHLLLGFLLLGLLSPTLLLYAAGLGVTPALHLLLRLSDELLLFTPLLVLQTERLVLRLIIKYELEIKEVVQ